VRQGSRAGESARQGDASPAASAQEPLSLQQSPTTGPCPRSSEQASTHPKLKIKGGRGGREVEHHAALHLTGLRVPGQKAVPLGKPGGEEEEEEAAAGGVSPSSRCSVQHGRVCHHPPAAAGRAGRRAGGGGGRGAASPDEVEEGVHRLLAGGHGGRQPQPGGVEGGGAGAGADDEAEGDGEAGGQQRGA